MALLPYFLSQISNSRHFLSLSFSRQYWSLSLFSPSPGRWIAPGWLYCSRLISLSPFPYCVPYFHIFHLPTMTRPVRYKALHFSLPASSLIFPLCQQQLPLLPLGAPSPPGSNHHLSIRTTYWSPSFSLSFVRFYSFPWPKGLAKRRLPPFGRPLCTQITDLTCPQEGLPPPPRSINCRKMCRLTEMVSICLFVASIALFEVIHQPATPVLLLPRHRTINVPQI